MPKLPVIISGGGIGGLTLANCLKISNIPFLVIERSPKLVEVGGGIGLWGPALKALNSIGLESKLTPHGKMMKSAGYRSHCQIDKGKWLVQPAYNLRRHTSCLTLRRHHLQMTLLNGLCPDEICYGKSVVSYIDNFENVDVVLDNGEVVRGSILVGADGINSTVRKTLNSDIVKRPCRYHYFQGICKINDLSTIDIGYNKNSDDFPSYEAWKTGIRFGIVPLKSPEVFWFIAYDEHLNDSVRRKSKQFINSLLKDFSENVTKIVSQTDEKDIRYYELNEISANASWFMNRTVLLGDAIHAMAPNLAQGALLSIEDALELAHQLYINDSSHKGILNAFKQYETNRKSRCKVVQTLVPWVHTVGAANGNLSLLRNATFNLSPRYLKTLVFDSTHRFALGWNYTPPNLGQGLYKRLLGYEFLSTTPILNKFHSGDIDRYCSGSINVQRGNILGNLMASICNLPKPLINGYIELIATIDKSGKEHWQRIFRDCKGGKVVSTFNTTQSLFNEELMEQYGPFFIVFVKIIKTQRFDLTIKEFGYY
jgi:2-polyprenyl-6-methoxyphenol hydroxylase-like FAD-dependent oxidoreductase